MALTVQNIRDWITDRTPADNLIAGDLEFTDAEIVSAITSATREFNSVPPVGYRCDPNNLPDDTNVFFEATAEILYKRKLHSLMRNDFKYDAGNVKVDMTSVKIENFKELIKMVSGWRDTARELKLRYDTSLYYNSF